MSLHNQTAKHLTSVDGTLHYLKRTTDKPSNWTFQPPPGTPFSSAEYEARKVRICDLRPLADSLSLDREGFLLMKHQSTVTDFYNEDQLRNVHYPEVQRLIAIASGGQRVVIFDHTVRRRVVDKSDRMPRIPRQPSARIHCDYSERSGPQRVHDLMGEEAEALLRRRFSIVNVWRPIRGPLRDAPLALCDATSVEPQDFVATDIVYPDRTGEYLGVTYRPGHRWFYAPEMLEDEVLVFKCYDAAIDSRARFVPHSGFVDPTAPAHVLPRESIELRAFVFH